MSPQNRNTSHPFRTAATMLLVVAWVAGLGLLALNRNNILDWWKLRQYTAPSDIAAIAQQDTMTDYGRRIFYINQPSIETKQTFSTSCPNNGDEKTIVLGCYHGGEAGIFVLQVSDSRLNGVQQVTAAHEMLHGAYERLSGQDRSRINGMLQDYYDHGLTDQRIKDVITAYRTSEPDDVVNEMHSVFGTEISKLPAPLEQYYTRYFTNRQQVAGFAAQYQAEFTSRTTQVEQDDKQLAVLKTRIDSSENDLKTRQATISERSAELTSLRSSSPAEYNAAVPGFNQLVDAYNGEIATVRSLISQYNSLVANRNAVAGEQDQLVQELSGNTAKPISQ